MRTLEEKRQAQREATDRWLAKPGNRKKHSHSVKVCRQRPHAQELHRIRQLSYASNNREQEKIRAAEWRKNNPEKARQSDRNNYLKNKDRVIAYNRKFRADHPELVSQWAKNRQGRKRAGGGDITLARIKELLKLQENSCAACAMNFVFIDYQIDHVMPLAKGGLHCDANIQLLCPTCNKRKSTRSMFDFLKILAAENA